VPDELVTRPDEAALPSPTLVRRSPEIPDRWIRRVRAALLLAIALYTAAFVVRGYLRNYAVFFLGYAQWMLQPRPWPLTDRPTHIFLIFADHFEPDYSVGRVTEWAGRYVAMASRHRDADGRRPQHTWFYPAEQSSPAIYEQLRRLTGAGYGEVEVHYHHEFDTADLMRDALRDATRDFNAYGFAKTIDGKTAFAFIHGNWGLDNSNGDWLCGVPREIDLLHELGCFADFTFPSVYEMAQPRQVNTIYAARDDDGPKSYDTWLPLSSLRDGTGRLMIFEGPLIFSPVWTPRQLFLHLEDGDIHAAQHASPRRADAWVRANVHVTERPDWVFIKLFGHSASTPEDMESAVGSDYDTTLSYLEREYNDGSRYVLHYITARQAYNLARSAAEGARGEPGEYLNAFIKPYVANRSLTETRPEP
jgi:hypothetical protein